MIFFSLSNRKKRQKYNHFENFPFPPFASGVVEGARGINSPSTASILKSGFLKSARVFERITDRMGDSIWMSV